MATPEGRVGEQVHGRAALVVLVAENVLLPVQKRELALVIAEPALLDDETADDVAMAGNSLRGGIHVNVRAMLERAKQVGGGDGVAH